MVVDADSDLVKHYIYFVNKYYSNNELFNFRKKNIEELRSEIDKFRRKIDEKDAIIQILNNRINELKNVEIKRSYEIIEELNEEKKKLLEEIANLKTKLTKQEEKLKEQEEKLKEQAEQLKVKANDINELKDDMKAIKKKNMEIEEAS